MFYCSFYFQHMQNYHNAPFYFIARHSLNKNQASSFVEWVITIVNGCLVESFAGDSYNLETLKIIIEDELIYDNYHNKLCINLKEYKLYICV